MKKNIIIIALLAAAVVAVVEIKNKKQAGSCATGCADGICTLPIPSGCPASEDPRGVVSVAKPLPKLLDLGAGKCVPCKTMAPILDEMKETFAGQLNVEFVDVRDNEGIGEKYGIRIIPTQIFFDVDGNELFRHEGFFAREDMLAKWQELGYAFGEPQNNE